MLFEPLMLLTLEFSGFYITYLGFIF